MVEITEADIQRAKDSQVKEFRNPELLAKAHAITDRFREPNVDGTALVDDIRSLLIQQGEWDYEQQVKDHPHGMPVDGLGTQDFAQNREDDLKEWLEVQFPSRDYIFMPNSAMGKYKDRWNWIHFREKDQAMLFKLTWY